MPPKVRMDARIRELKQLKETILTEPDQRIDEYGRLLDNGTMKEVLGSAIDRELAGIEQDELQKQAAKQFVKNAYMRYFKQQVAKNEPTGISIIDNIPDAVKKYLVKEDESQAYIITISGKEDIDPKLFWRRLTEFISRNDFLEYKIYVLEQRSEDDQPAYGWHIHIIAESSIPKCKMVDKIYKSFNRFVAARNFVDIHKIQTDLDYRIEYLKGNKQEPKMKKVAKDKILKEQLGIPLFVEK